MKSLARKFLLSVGAMSVAVTAVASIAAFVTFQRVLVDRQVAFMSDYVRERSEREGRRFSDLVVLHRSAELALRRRIETMSDADAERQFERWFPLQPDGTRRSAPDSFDGMRSPDGEVSYGMAAFLAHPERLDRHERKVLVAAYSVVSHFGEAVRGAYDNLYFFTPNTRLVMFGPERPDRLMFYRKTAPATLDVSREEMTTITLPASNPARVTRCTKLRALLSDRKAAKMGVSCSTPVDIESRHVGAFGSSIQLSSYLERAVKDVMPGAANLIVSDAGEMVAYPGFARPGVASPETIARFERDMQLKATIAKARAKGGDSGVVTSPDGRRIVAYGRLGAPDWWFLISYPRGALAWSAARSASWILLIGLAASLVQGLLIVLLARRTMVHPLQRLAQSAGWRGRRRIRVSISEVEARDDEIGLLARALRDERTKANNLLASLEDRVKRRTAELENANREKSRFLANMSHELRTPLNGVVAVSEVLARAQKTRRNRELAELVASSGRLLEQVLTDILDFSKIEAGQVTLDPCDFDLETVIGQVAQLHGAVAEKKGLGFRWSVERSARGAWRGDPVRLTQILSNLLSNAVKFTHEGEVELTVKADDQGLRARVRDTGVGFDEDVRGRLFKRFQQADASVTRKFGGTGLGLSISGSLAELMGGRIEASSTPGEGAVFEAILPLPRALASTVAELAAEARPQAGVAGARILVAEDHPTNQRVARLILEAAGVEVTIVENGREAVDAVAADDFDVILMDMQMPEMDGLTATRMIRDQERAAGLPRRPIFMLTANALDEHRQASLAAGADRHLAKPLRPPELLAAIAEALQGPEQAMAV